MHGLPRWFSLLKKLKKGVSVQRWLPLLLVCSALAWGCARSVPQPQMPPPLPPSPLVGTIEQPETFVSYLRPGNQGMRSWRELEPTVRKSLRYVKAKQQGGIAIARPGLKLTWGQMERTLERLLALLPRLDRQPELFLQNFTWVEVEEGIKYSGYYEPVLKASRHPTPECSQPLYARPPELSACLARKGCFYDRRAIDCEGVLDGRGLELAWADPVDVFFLQIQGSGRLKFDDGSSACVNYDGQNRHKYRSSGRIMGAQKLLKRGDILEQRQWFKKHPGRVREILNQNPSYVFFKFGRQGATGAIGESIDPWRSLATSRSFIPLGAVVAYGVNIPDVARGRAPLRGIALAQDVGGAIKGNRIDIFCGSGQRAEYVASCLDAKGPAWVLVAR